MGSDHEKEWNEKEAMDTKYGTKFRMNIVGLLDPSCSSPEMTNFLSLGDWKEAVPSKI